MTQDSASIEYIISDYSTYPEGDVHVAWDCIARLVTELQKYNMVYDIDYNIASSHINRDGKKAVVMLFNRQEDAMMVKLGGIEGNNNG